MLLEITDDDVVAIFNNLVDLLVKADERVKSREAKNTFNKGDEEKIRAAIRNGNNNRKDYTGNLNMQRDMKLTHYQPVGENVNRMRKFINTHSHEMNKLFPKMGLPKVSTEIIGQYC